MLKRLARMCSSLGSSGARTIGESVMITGEDDNESIKCASELKMYNVRVGGWRKGVGIDKVYYTRQNEVQKEIIHHQAASLIKPSAGRKLQKAGWHLHETQFPMRRERGWYEIARRG